MHAMTNQVSQIKWGRALLTGVVVYVLSFLLIFLIVSTYAMVLGIQARGAPDQTMIQAFANRHAPWIGPVCLVLFTFLGASWLARRVDAASQLHGLVVGILVGAINLILAGFGISDLIATVLIVAAGWLGGNLAARH